MEATILIAGEQAVLRGWHWICTDKSWEDILNDMLDPDGPSGADPQPAINEARRIAKILGAEVIDEKVDTRPLLPDVVY